ncbi:MAG: LamG domain-containing protein, partial [Nanobdellota archaeon]
NLTSDDLDVAFSTSDPDSDPVIGITDWRIDGTSIASLNMPFNTNITSTSTGAVNDYSTYDNDGTLGGGTLSYVPTWTSEGKVGGAYEFDGSGTINGTVYGDNIEIPESITNTANNPKGTTYSVWLNADTDAVDRMSLFRGSSTIRHIEIYTESKKFRTEAAKQNGYSFGTGNFPYDVRGTWSHFAIVFAENEPDRPVRWYQNGELFYTGDLSSGDYPDTEYFSFGSIARSTGTTSYTYAKSFDGKIDEVQIFDRALSSEQISNIYNAGLAGHSVETMDSSETSYLDIWTVDVTPNDAFEDGTSVLSNDITISSPYPELVYNNTFENSTTEHAFFVTAGAYYEAGGTGIDNDYSIDNPACSFYDSTVSGNYFNVTYKCTGTPYTSDSVSITICDEFSQCVSTPTTSNTYPNQAPTMNSLLTPTNGNDTVHDLTPTFTWETASDAESDTLTYYFNLSTIVGCQDVSQQTLSSTSFTPSSELCPSALDWYEWTVKVCDEWGDCSSWHANWTFILEPYIDIEMVTDSVDFGIMDILDSDSTTSGSPAPFHFRSDSNVVVDLTNVTAPSSIWVSSLGSLGSDYMQLKSRELASESGSFNTASSLTDWFNLMTESQDIISELDYSDSADESYVDLKLTVPSDEPPGSKSTSLTFMWEES